MDRLLFPTEKQLQNSWTTCSEISKLGVEILPLDDDVLQVHKVTTSTSHQLVSPPSGVGPTAPNVVWEAFYPRGSINPKNSIPGGFGFYLSGPPGFQTGLRTANEVLFSYSVMFDEEWDFAKGGKLPGICDRWGGRFRIWVCRRAEGRQMPLLLPSADVEARGIRRDTYMPDYEKNTKALLAVRPRSYGNRQVGFSVGRGSFVFPRGQWTTVAERVKLNDPGEENGELELRVDGKVVISVGGLIYRENDASTVQGAHFQTFFGGNTGDWASPKDQRAWFANVSGAILG